LTCGKAQGGGSTTQTNPRPRQAPSAGDTQTKASGRAAREIDTLIIGGGQAGLAVSYHLTREGWPHLVIERDRVGASWLKRRWDSFCLVTPNWTLQLPGFPCRGADPDGFLPRDEIVRYLEAYARSFDAPVELGVAAERLTRRADGSGYRIETDHGPIEANNAVVTIGYFHRPSLPAFASSIPASVRQLHSSEYRNPAALAPGAVLVVGSAQSGCQIAEELHEAGRRVYLSLGSAGRFPRRYRGRDSDAWLADMGAFDEGFADPADPVERYRPNPHASGGNGGHSLNLRRFAKDGITLLGRVTGAAGRRLAFAGDVNEKVAKADQFSRDVMKEIDDYIAANSIAAREADATNSDDGDPDGGPIGVPYEGPPLPEIRSLDLEAEGITSIIWATGYSCDFDWINLPVTDVRGYPIQDRGVSHYPGLYFCGLHWLYSLKSGLLFGVGEAAVHVAGHLAAARPWRGTAAAPARPAQAASARAISI
jgi:putative flavoprotein involved in K+ transport